MMTYEEALDFVLQNSLNTITIEVLLSAIYEVPVQEVAMTLLVNLGQEEYR